MPRAIALVVAAAHPALSIQLSRATCMGASASGVGGVAFAGDALGCLSHAAVSHGGDSCDRESARPCGSVHLWGSAVGQTVGLAVVAQTSPVRPKNGRQSSTPVTVT